ncbi:hypothetical protein Pla52o_30690 [Novipirellula galeiformis]|uniref:Uncharacterized protein n=1 Tax=Novipirellula galeiformis TaxID=2528004 RepID=A0A5C6CF21_9BACT|nr:hypothetical protein [Novipirellula galeiformis]TWU22021.1 hypothetical protein Pla52o_30690 [Novipirellula galeiformis]
MQTTNLSRELTLHTATPENEPVFIDLANDIAERSMAARCPLRARRSAVILCLLTTLVGFILGGCSDDSAAQEIRTRRACLVELASQYRLFQEQNGAAPENVGQFAEFINAKQPPVTDSSAKSEANIVSESLIRLADGDMMLLYNGVPASDPAFDPEAILGFEATVPSSGGYVVTANGDAKHVSAKVFAESKKVATINKAPSL